MKKYRVIKPYFGKDGSKKIGTIVELDTPNQYVVPVEDEPEEPEKPKRKRGTKK